MATYAEILQKVNQLKNDLNTVEGVSASIDYTCNSIGLNVSGDGEHVPYFGDDGKTPALKWIWVWYVEDQEWTPYWVTALPNPDDNSTTEGVLNLVWTTFS